MFSPIMLHSCHNRVQTRLYLKIFEHKQNYLFKNKRNNTKLTCLAYKLYKDINNILANFKIFAAL